MIPLAEWAFLGPTLRATAHTKSGRLFRHTFEPETVLIGAGAATCFSALDARAVAMSPTLYLPTGAESLDEAGLRAAVAKLGPAFESVSRNSQR